MQIIKEDKTVDLEKLRNDMSNIYPYPLDDKAGELKRKINEHIQSLNQMQKPSDRINLNGQIKASSLFASCIKESKI